MGIICVQDIYKCDTCKSADEYGRNCKHGMLFPTGNETVYPLEGLLELAEDIPAYKIRIH